MAASTEARWTARGWYRLSGAGNDFLAAPVDGDDPDLPPPSLVRAWCRRGLGLGADGLFTLRRAADGDRAVPTVTMVHANPDGGRSDLCLNGSRCAVRLARALGWFDPARPAVLRTDAGALDVVPGAGPSDDPHAVALTLPPSLVAQPSIAARALRVGDATHPVDHLTVGVPHVVRWWHEADDGPLAAAPLAQIGPPLRRHPDLGAAGANVHLVRVDAADRIAVRSFERGVEMETLACGTGVVAAVLAGTAAGRLTLPTRARVASDVELVVARAPGDRLVLAGDARIVAEVRPRPDGVRRAAGDV
ncbi:MAG: diaminopimelate epimerase [Acidobacteriota bacterium]